MINDLPDAKWSKSSHSGGGGDCVEVAWLDRGLVGVRDSKNPVGPALRFTVAEWGTFVSALRANNF